MGPPDGKGNGKDKGNGDSTSLNIVTFNETPNKGADGDDIVFADISFTEFESNHEDLGFLELDYIPELEDQAEFYKVGENWYSFDLGAVDFSMIDVGDSDPDDSLWGNEGDDFLFAGPGNDLIYASSGNDYIDGGDHDPGQNKVWQIGDSVNYNGFNTGDTLEIDLDPDGDLLTNDGYAEFHWDGEDDLSEQTLVNIESIRGSKGDDIIKGDENANTLNGQPGDDMIRGRGGNDELIGGTGSDIIDGGMGNDILTGGWDPESASQGKRIVDVFVFEDDSGNDTITDYNAGYDIIVLPVGYSLDAGVVDPGVGTLFTILDADPDSEDTDSIFLEGYFGAAPETTQASDWVAPDGWVDFG